MLLLELIGIVVWYFSDSAIVFIGCGMVFLDAIFLREVSGARGRRLGLLPAVLGLLVADRRQLVALRRREARGGRGGPASRGPTQRADRIPVWGSLFWPRADATPLWTWKVCSSRRSRRTGRLRGRPRTSSSRTKRSPSWTAAFMVERITAGSCNFLYAMFPFRRKPRQCVCKTVILPFITCALECCFNPSSLPVSIS